MSEFRIEWPYGPMFRWDDPDLPEDPGERQALIQGPAFYYVDNVQVSEEEYMKRAKEEKDRHE